MSCEISIFSYRIGFLAVFGCLLSLPIADASNTFTLFYAGEEGGQLGLHGCGTDQVGGLSRRQTVIQSLHEKRPALLNLHTGNILNPADPNSELVCQIALEALSTMHYDAVCLGPRDLCFPIDSLSALYANHTDLPVVCTNIVGAQFARPFEVVEAAERKVAVVGLISKSYEFEVAAYNPVVTLAHPREALETLAEEITRQSDFVVGVFHGSDTEARELAERFSWLSVLVLAQNESSAEISTETPIIVGNTTIAINPAKGEAVGVLKVGLDANLQHVVSRKNQRVTVSEGIAPDADLESLLALYDSLSESDEFDRQGSVPDDRAVHITYFHKRGCQKCVRASEILKHFIKRIIEVDNYIPISA